MRHIDLNNPEEVASFIINLNFKTKMKSNWNELDKQEFIYVFNNTNSYEVNINLWAAGYNFSHNVLIYLTNKLQMDKLTHRDEKFFLKQDTWKTCSGAIITEERKLYPVSAYLYDYERNELKIPVQEIEIGELIKPIYSDNVYLIADYIDNNKYFVDLLNKDGKKESGFIGIFEKISQ